MHTIEALKMLVDTESAGSRGNAAMGLERVAMATAAHVRSFNPVAFMMLNYQRVELKRCMRYLCGVVSVHNM